MIAMKLKRKFIITPGYHDTVPGRYGISSGQTHMAVIGPKGAVEFHFFNPWYPETVHTDRDWYVIGGVERHSKKRTHKWQTPTLNCAYTGGKCYCDGSSTWADKWHKLLVHAGSEAVFTQLEVLYEHWFNNGPAPDLSYNPHGDVARFSKEPAL